MAKLKSEQEIRIEIKDVSKAQTITPEFKKGYTAALKWVLGED